MALTNHNRLFVKETETIEPNSNPRTKLKNSNHYLQNTHNEKSQKCEVFFKILFQLWTKNPRQKSVTEETFHLESEFLEEPFVLTGLVSLFEDLLHVGLALSFAGSILK